MDVKTLCLGVLSFGEASGYDIKKFFECTFSHFFVAGYGSIYPALAKLTEKGWVTCHCEPQEGKPDRKVYAITEAGREAFEDELIHTEPCHKIRSEFLVLTYFAHLIPRERLSQIFDQRIAGFEDALEQIKVYRRQQEECGDCDPPGMRFAAGYGEKVLRTARDFVRKHRDTVENADN